MLHYSCSDYTHGRPYVETNEACVHRLTSVFGQRVIITLRETK